MILLYFIFGLLIFLLGNQEINGLNCRDSNGNKVQWFVAIKPPGSGIKRYFYKTSLDKALSWYQSDKDIFSNPGSVLLRTIGKIYKKHEKYDYIMYNDKLPPHTTPSSLSPRTKSNPQVFKHSASKGVFIFTKPGSTKSQKAIWIIHSVPGFMAPFTTRYSPPEGNGLEYAQIFMCFEINRLNVPNILDQLILLKPRVYSRSRLDPILKEAQNRVYDSTIGVKSINLAHAAVASIKTYPTPIDGVPIKVITKTSKDLDNVWMKTLNYLNTESNFYIKSYPNGNRNYITGSSDNQFKEATSFGFERERWSSTADSSQWGFTITDKYFCVSDISPPEQPKETANNVCIGSQFLVDGMKKITE